MVTFPCLSNMISTSRQSPAASAPRHLRPHHHLPGQPVAGRNAALGPAHPRKSQNHLTWFRCHQYSIYTYIYIVTVYVYSVYIYSIYRYILYLYNIHINQIDRLIGRSVDRLITTTVIGSYPRWLLWIGFGLRTNSNLRIVLWFITFTYVYHSNNHRSADSHWMSNCFCCFISRKASHEDMPSHIYLKTLQDGQQQKTLKNIKQWLWIDRIVKQALHPVDGDHLYHRICHTRTVLGGFGRRQLLLLQQPDTISLKVIWMVHGTRTKLGSDRLDDLLYWLQAIQRCTQLPWIVPIVLSFLPFKNQQVRAARTFLLGSGLMKAERWNSHELVVGMRILNAWTQLRMDGIDSIVALQQLHCSCSIKIVEP